MSKKTVLISGATSGIGQACAVAFAEAGFDLILTGRREQRLIDLSRKIKEKHKVAVQFLTFDIQINKECVEAISKITQDIDVLINNAGLSQGLNPIQSGDLADWDTMIDTNVKGLLYLSKLIIPKMVKKGSGHIINLGSIAAKEVYPNGNVYCASKHAVDAITKGMRMDLLPLGIKVSLINPGLVNTEFSLVRFKGDKEKADKVYHGYDPLQAVDIAEAILFMATRPAHVNIDDLLIMPTAQASATQVLKK
ncbi:MAG: 3-hydroxy acid dehydrogenase/malonic semialdehyde reductase [Sphingobacteriales bacterium]|jgi:3-hydroxy acid dehydrogenase/malonic semialdehyde reductase